MELLTSADRTDYELIDTGNREKLERFGKYILIRPEPQAVWQKSMSESEWEKLSHARYMRMKGKKPDAGENERGSWNRKPDMPERWNIGYRYRQINLTFRLGLTAFGHIGVFPEQAINWNYIYDLITQNSKLKTQNPETETGIPESRIPHPASHTPHPEPLRLHRRLFAGCKGGRCRRRSCRFSEACDHMGQGDDGGEWPR